MREVVTDPVQAIRNNTNSKLYNMSADDLQAGFETLLPLAPEPSGELEKAWLIVKHFSRDPSARPWIDNEIDWQIDAALRTRTSKTSTFCLELRRFTLRLKLMDPFKSRSTAEEPLDMEGTLSHVIYGIQEGGRSQSLSGLKIGRLTSDGGGCKNLLWGKGQQVLDKYAHPTRTDAAVEWYARRTPLYQEAVCSTYTRVMSIKRLVQSVVSIPVAVWTVSFES